MIVYKWAVLSDFRAIFGFSPITPLTRHSEGRPADYAGRFPPGSVLWSPLS